VDEGAATIQSVSESNTRCLDAGIHDNPYTEYSVEELTLLYEELKAVLANKITLVHNMKARKGDQDRCDRPPPYWAWGAAWARVH
jgi:hypothetical protein